MQQQPRRLFHILNADEIRAKRDVKTTDWTRVGWESLQYALTHVATGMPFLQRMRRLFRWRRRSSRTPARLVKIRCERGSYIAKKLGFSAPVAEAFTAWTSTGTDAGIRIDCAGEEIPMFSRIANLRRRWKFSMSPAARKPR